MSRSRTLTTIGSLHGPVGRSRARRASMHALYMGDMSPDLQVATDALDTYLRQNGTHQGTNGGNVAAFQVAWNKAPLAGSGISVDDEYGPNTQGALQMALTQEGSGAAAPANAYTGKAAVIPSPDQPEPGPPFPLPPPPPPVPPAVVPSGGGGGSSGGGMSAGVVLVAVAVAAGLYLVFRKKKGAGSHAHPMVEVRTHNPRRRARASAVFARVA